MSFTYDFVLPHDTVYFAYCIPYTYTRLTRFIARLKNVMALPPLKTLTGLPIPLLLITDEDQPEYNKQVVLVTSRIHPGQSNASFVVEGMLQFLCGNDSTAKQLRKTYIFYVLPMLNPDGVVAGNYRTSLFGKDLNRTFDQSRKYAFPQTFHLVELTKQLKAKHKKRFNLYLDLHGHSVKKNVFMYGPQFSIQHSFYDISRELPKILGNLTSLFRYYSCIFRISGEKATTARAILNRKIDIPFTYTMEASNGFYIDKDTKNDTPFTSKKLREMGVYLCKGLSVFKFDQNFRVKKNQTQKISKDDYTQPQKNSDDQISEGNSDSQPQNEDLSQKQLEKIQKHIEGKSKDTIDKNSSSPHKSVFIKKFQSAQLEKKERVVVFLPPINSLNRAVLFSDRSRKKELLKKQRLYNIESHKEVSFDRHRSPRYSIGELGTDYRKRQDFKPLKIRRQSKRDHCNILFNRNKPNDP